MPVIASLTLSMTYGYKDARALAGDCWQCIQKINEQERLEEKKLGIKLIILPFAVAGVVAIIYFILSIIIMNLLLY